MRLQWVCLAVVVCGGLGAAWFDGTPPSVAADERAILSQAIVTLPALGAEPYTYVGSKKCKMCHMKLYKSWAKTEMGMAFKTLKPGEAKEAKEKHNVDVDKDYTRDAACVKCHTTGHGHDGGYVIPDPNDKKAVKAAKKREGIGCESCHGPGSEYVKVFKDIFMSKRKYKVEELYAVGMRKIEESTCTTCHNAESPTIDAATPFDFEKRKTEGIHEHQVLKQRDG